MPKYRVTMCRIGYGFKTFQVEARTRYEAEEKAYGDAGNYEYPEKSSNYEIDAIEEVEEKGCQKVCKRELAGEFIGEEIRVILAAARIALADAEVFDILANQMGLADSVMISLREKLSGFLNDTREGKG